MLSEDSRSRLDGIVQQMAANNESDADIQFVVSDFKSKYDTPQTTTSPSFTGGVSDAWAKRGANIAQNWTDTASKYDPRQQEGAVESFTKGPGRLFRTAGQIAGGVNDVVGQGIMAGYRNLLSPEQQQSVSGLGRDILQSGPVQSAMPAIKSMAEGYGQLKKEYPQDVGNLEAAGNIAGIVPMGWLGAKGPGAVKNFVGEGIDMVKGAVTPGPRFASAVIGEGIEQKIDQAIVSGVKKGIKPSVVGKSDAGLTKKYYDNAKTAVRDIVDSSDVPLSKSQNILEDFSQAVKNTKIKLHDQYSKMAVDAGESGALVNLRPVIDDIRVMTIDSNLQRANPNIVSTLNKYLDNWEKNPASINPSDAEELIAMLNSKAKAFWKDPNMHSEAALNERIAQQLRKQTFDTINDYQGPGYAELRKRYGAQLALEKEVADRATVAGRRADFGFFDIANIPTAGEFVRSALTADPAGIAKAGIMMAVKSKMKSLNDPSNIIRKMFKDVETLNAIKAKYPSPTAAVPGGPMVRSSAIDDMIKQDIAMRNSIRNEAANAQYGNVADMPSAPGKVPSDLEKALANPDSITAGRMATDAGDLDTAMRISPAERDLFSAAQMAQAGELKPITARLGGTPIIETPTSLTPSLESMSEGRRAVGLGLDSAAQIRRYDEPFGAGVRSRQEQLREAIRKHYAR
jgi:hypothetical protein